MLNTPTGSRCPLLQPFIVLFKHSINFTTISVVVQLGWGAAKVVVSSEADTTTPASLVSSSAGCNMFDNHLESPIDIHSSSPSTSTPRPMLCRIDYMASNSSLTEFSRFCFPSLPSLGNKQSFNTPLIQRSMCNSNPSYFQKPPSVHWIQLNASMTLPMGLLPTTIKGIERTQKMGDCLEALCWCHWPWL